MKNPSGNQNDCERVKIVLLNGQQKHGYGDLRLLAQQIIRYENRATIANSIWYDKTENSHCKILRNAFQTSVSGRILDYKEYMIQLQQRFVVHPLHQEHHLYKGMRIKYKDKNETFLESHLVSKEPFGQFKAWFEEACIKKEILEPNAMCLATATREGYPSARFVLCKGYGKDGFKFFTNYGSRKAREMAENPNVAATFYWEVLNRSIRIEGQVEKLPEDESTKYFHSRPMPSQIAACTSYQSTPIQSRDVLCDRESLLEAEYMIPGKEVPKPEFWGGYIIRPKCIEFWQGQRDRLHDRIKFRKPKDGEVPDGKLLHEGEEGWVFERLSP